MEKVKSEPDWCEENYIAQIKLEVSNKFEIALGTYFAFS